MTKIGQNMTKIGPKLDQNGTERKTGLGSNCY